MNLNQILTFSVVLTAIVLSTGCANSSARYQPIIDGEITQLYNHDLTDCQSLATQRSFTNGDVKSQALAGAVIGGIIGAIEEGSEGAVAGVLVGSTLEGGTRAWETRDERKDIVIQCMKQRGHRVVG